MRIDFRDLGCGVAWSRTEMASHLAGRAFFLALWILMALFGARTASAAEPMAPADIRTTFFNGQPFTATSPSGTKFTMIFTPDGKMTREPIQQSGSKSAGPHVEAQRQGILHRLGSHGRQLLHGPSQRRKQMVGAKNRNHHRNDGRGLVEIRFEQRLSTSASTSADIRVKRPRYRAGAAGQAFGAGLRSFPSTARSSRPCARAQTAP